jgi:hypothetical protein
MTEEPAHSHAIARHPSASLYDRVFALAMPAVLTVAAHKNVTLLDGEAEAVMHDALKGTPRKVLKRVLQGDENTCFAVSLAMSHTLDVLAAKRFILVLRRICEEPPLDDAALSLEAEDALKNRFANDKELTIRIWRNLVDDLADHINSATAAPTVTLPRGNALRIDMRRGRGSTPIMPRVHAATEAVDG